MATYKGLKELSSEMLSPAEFKEYIYDYHNNAAEYGIDVDSSYFTAIKSAFDDLEYGYHHTVKESKSYKKYKKIFKK